MPSDPGPLQVEVRANDTLANERTYLAYVRTALAFIAFGFVIARFSLFEREFAVLVHRPGEASGLSTTFGTVMAFFGIFMALLGAWRYAATDRRSAPRPRRYALGSHSATRSRSSSSRSAPSSQSRSCCTDNSPRVRIRIDPSPKSSAGALCVSQPVLMRSTPVAAISPTFCGFTPPLASVRTRPSGEGHGFRRVARASYCRGARRRSVPPALRAAARSYRPRPQPLPYARRATAPPEPPRESNRQVLDGCL